MPHLSPVGDSEPVELAFEFDVDQSWIDSVIDATGEKPPRRFEVTFDLREVARELRPELRRAHAIYKAVPWYPLLAEPTDDPWIIANAILGRWRSEQAAEAEEEVERRQEEARRAAVKADVMRWIDQHGSRRLQLAAIRGYNINRLYARERAAKDLPGFWVDFGRKALVRERANPSEEALDLETVVDDFLQTIPSASESISRIVWLARFPPDMQEHADLLDDVSEQGEALKIDDWLGRYPVYLPVDPALRAPSGGDQ